MAEPANSQNQAAAAASDSTSVAANSGKARRSSREWVGVLLMAVMPVGALLSTADGDGTLVALVVFSSLPALVFGVHMFRAARHDRLHGADPRPTPLTGPQYGTRLSGPGGVRGAVGDSLLILGASGSALSAAMIVYLLLGGGPYSSLGVLATALFVTVPSMAALVAGSVLRRRRFA